MTTSAKPSIQALMLGATGVVFGDIGTSPLYAFREVFAGGRVPFSHANVLAATSMFIWALILVVAFKYVALVILPIVAVATLRRQPSVRAALKVIVWWAVLGGAVLAFGLAPFYDLDAIRTSIRDQSDILLTSPGAVLFHELRLRDEPESVSHTIIRLGQAIAAAAILLLTLLAALRPAKMIRYAFEAFFILLIFGVPALREWYGIWIIALAALLPLGWPAARGVVFAMGALASYGVAIWIQAWRGTNFGDIGIFMVLLMLGPAIVIALLEAADSYAWWRVRRALALTPSPSPDSRRGESVVSSYPLPELGEGGAIAPGEGLSPGEG